MSLILGLDEAGRGAWAGPLVVAAVLGSDYDLGVCRDSKTLSETQRIKILEVIQKRAAFVAVGWSATSEIDRLGIEKASSLAARRAISALSHYSGEIMIDGQRNWLSGKQRTDCLVRADQLIPQVAAASIVAKVFRDRWMTAITDRYDKWHFQRHKGYGTQLHRDDIADHGLCPLHRTTYRPISSLCVSSVITKQTGDRYPAAKGPNRQP